MRNLAIALLLFCSNLAASEKAVVRPTPNSELTAAAAFLSKLPPDSQVNTRFFTTYAVPARLQEKTALTLSFVCHSLIGPGQDETSAVGAYYPIAKMDADKFVPMTQVPGSNTLYYIDLRWFNWSAAAWEEAARQDAYFDILWVDPNLQGVSSYVLRADWFIAHVTDPTYQVDREEKKVLHREFLYAKVNKPLNIEDFRKIWGVDAADLQKRQLQFGTLVTRDTTVSLRNRILALSRTSYGNYCETSDVKNDLGVRDYKNNIPLEKPIPQVRDASEAITNNVVGLQVYDLFDGKGGIVEFADATVVRDRAKNDVRVKVLRSCITCHALGLIPSENTSVDDLKQGVYLNIKDYTSKLKFERVYLSGGAVDVIDDGQRIFEKAMSKVNGLKPDVNAKNYDEVVSWYETPVDVAQAALECGLGEKEYRVICDQSVSGNLASLVKYDRTMPRTKWDVANQDGVPGEYVNSMLLIHSISLDQFIKTGGPVDVVLPPQYVVMEHANQIYLDDKSLTTIPAGTKLKVVKSEQDKVGMWYRVEFSNQQLWVKGDLVKQVR